MGTGGATIQTHNHGVGGGRCLGMLAHIYKVLGNMIR